MNNAEKEVLRQALKSEKAVLKALEKQYETAMGEIDDKIAALLGRNDANLPHVIHQVQYQRLIKEQIRAALDRLHAGEYETIGKYLQDSYTNGFVGTMYSLHRQGVPVIVPIDQDAAIKAVTIDSKLQEPLYESLGVDVGRLKKSIASEITRGIAAGQTYAEMARNIRLMTGAPLSRARTIVRTEAGRVQEQAHFDAANKARAAGADVVKQWSAVLDGKTRDSHRKLDHQIRELDKPFELDGKKAMYPHDFGDPAEDCNCRCTQLTRARAMLDEDELKVMRERAAFFGVDKSEDFEDFKRKYLKAAEKEAKIEPVKAIQFESGEKANQFFYYDDYENSRGLTALRNSQYGKWRRGLSADEKDCISDYTGGGYSDLNKYLRQVGDWQSINAAKEEFIAKSLDSAISRYKLKDTIRVQRGAGKSSLDVLFMNNDIEELSDLIGKKYTDDAFMSTTALYGNPVATTKPVVMDIEIPFGTGRGAYINQLAGQYQDTEYEFLIKRGSSFTITDISEDVDLDKVYVKMVMDVE